MSTPLRRCAGAVRAIRRCVGARRAVQMCTCDLTGRYASHIAAPGLVCVAGGTYYFSEFTTPTNSQDASLGEVYLVRIAGVSAPAVQAWDLSTIYTGLRLMPGPGSWPWNSGNDLVRAIGRTSDEACEPRPFDRWYVFRRQMGVPETWWRLSWDSTMGEFPPVDGRSECFAEIVECRRLVRQEFQQGPEAHVRPVQPYPHRIETGPNGSLGVFHYEPIAFGRFAGKRVRVQLSGGHAHPARPIWTLAVLGLGAPGQPVYDYVPQYQPEFSGNYVTLWQAGGGATFALDQVFDFTNNATFPTSIYSRAVLLVKFATSGTNGIDDSFCIVNGVSEA